MKVQFRKISKIDFEFIKAKLIEKDLSFDGINFDVSFVGIRDDYEIVTYLLLSNSRNNLPEILKHTDAYIYKVVDIYMKDGHEDDLSRTSYYLIKSLKQYAYMWCDFSTNIPRGIIEAALFTEANDSENNDHFYFINTLDIGTLNEEDSQRTSNDFYIGHINPIGKRDCTP